jgi:dTDP-4-amino-4,6-dideoxygalactose transaminase
MKRILLSPPDMGTEERKLLLEAFDSNWIAPVGPQLEAFEREVCELVGVPHAVALSSGTAALHLGLIAVGVRPGDRVIVPTLTFAATANAVVYCGAEPVFVDVSADSWTLDPFLLAEELEANARAGRRVAAIMPVDLYGQCADYGRIAAVAEQYGVPIVSDAAESLGASYRGRQAGTFGACAAFSFNGNKIITSGGGGMLVSRDRAIVERARYLSTQAREPVPHYEHTSIGYNYRMSNLLAAIGRGQLRGLSAKVARRRQINRRYIAALGQQPGLSFMPQPDYSRPNGWLTTMIIDPARFGAGAELVRRHLEHHGIETRPVWKPLHLQPVFRECTMRGGQVAEALFAHGLCLPSGSSLSDVEQSRVIASIQESRRMSPAPASRADRPAVAV